ncbi:MAG TPA: chemotaxis protein CheA [Pseudomonadales bacterium]|nr:chemotaxis protein CheA [Pseudomonadales bacterium]
MSNGLDMSQFHEIFMEEGFESLAIMERGLLAFDAGAPDAEAINDIFRAAHSIKGGAATFGFPRVADFTHILESLLERVRAGAIELNPARVDLLLEGVDCVRQMLRNGEDDAASHALAEGLAIRLSAFESQTAPPDPAPTAPPSAPVAAEDVQTPPVEDGTAALWQIGFRPHRTLMQTGNDPFRLIRELGTLGEMQVTAAAGDLPALAALEPTELHLAWDIGLSGDVARADIDEVFAWVLGDCELVITAPGGAADADAAGAFEAELDAQVEAEIDAETDAAIEAELAGESAATAAEDSAGLQAAEDDLLQDPAPAADDGRSAGAGDVTLSNTETSSVRVNIDKIEQLINLVGELVITQSALAQQSREFVGRDDIQRTLQQLGNNIQELQEQSMRIRMLPIDSVFQRLPRLVRDLRTRLGKNVVCRIIGKDTEVDKTVLEKLGDPVVHLIRNAIDHGIEAPEERRRLGKAEEAVITLRAEHRGGNILITIADDGRGLDQERIRAKALERGLISGDKVLVPGQIQDLIFLPGFSTAESVSDVSGRGVGLDVVRQNIRSLGGDVRVRSTPGEGSEFQITLPLTLAVLDGQLVRVGGEVFILPIVNIEKSIRIDRSRISVVPGHRELYRLGSDIVPMLRLAEYYDCPQREQADDDGILVVLDVSQRAGVVVDEVLGQQQVVVRSLESNFRRIDTLAGATILGDGMIALIIDANEIVRAAQPPAQTETMAARRGLR